MNFDVHLPLVTTGNNRGSLSTKMQSVILFSLCLILIVAVSGGCKQEMTDSTVNGMPASLEYDQVELLHLKTIETVLVKEDEQLDRSNFHVSARTKAITQFPCSSCHSAPLTETPRGEVDTRSAHTDIQLRHAGESVMTCQTCHNYQRVETLHLLNEGSIDFNHSYQLCIQCHFQQGKDWAGGAHGKRLAGWKGKRVVMNCTDCHDPHSPAFDKRWPHQFPRIPRSGNE